MDEQTENRILTQIRKLANGWQKRYRTPLLGYDEYYSIGLQSYYTIQKQFEGSDPLIIESLTIRRANWDMKDAVRTARRHDKTPIQEEKFIHTKHIDKRTMNGDRELSRSDVRSILNATLEPDDAKIAIYFVVEGLTLPEIAKEVGLPTTTVSWRWYNIRQQMKTDKRILQFLEDCKYGTS